MSNKKNVLFLREEYGDGHGTFTYPDGIMYVGEFKDGLKNGKGTLTSPYGENYEGQIYLGVWKDDEPWNGTQYDKDGNILVEWVNGKGIEQ